MNKLVKILSKYSLSDIIKIEEQDRQFLALKKMNDEIHESLYFFPLIITNAIICYQLSGKGEDYWEEFSDRIINYKLEFISYKNFSFEILHKFFEDFLPNSKGNKRLVNMKILRIKKLQNFFKDLIGKEKYFYDNIEEFQLILAKNLKQNKEDKTILFACKMFYYGAKIKFGYENIVSFNIGIPLDSRLAKLEKIYNTSCFPRQIFWQKISREVGIPLLHLDSLLWTKCDEFICKD